jgi:GTP:adenosylcobinamide-phosphate guanylyltransferase
LSYTALLLAGQRPGPDRLAGNGLKALIPVAGRPMVARVAETLLACPSIDRIVVLAQDDAALRPHLPDDPRIAFATSQAGISRSVAAAAAAGRWPVLVTTADHPLLTVATIEDFLARAGGCDVAVGVVERAVVRRRFPANRRTWLKFRGGWWTGANLFALNGTAAANALNLWSEIEQDRKKGWKLVARFGPLLLVRALTRTITLADALSRAGRSIGVGVRAVSLDDPLAAVDVDKAEDLALAEAVFAGSA